MSNITRYDAKDCTVMVDGVYVTGLGEDMVTFEKEENYFEAVVGAQGDVVKSIINNDIHTLTITVQPTSPQKGFLMSLSKRSETFPIWVVNKALGEKFGGTQANVQTAPSVERGATAADMEFTFCVFDGVVDFTN